MIKLVPENEEELHLIGKHDQSTHGHGGGASGLIKGAKLENDLNKSFGNKTAQRIREEGHDIEDYDFRDKDGNLTGKPKPGSESWKKAHGIDKDVYDSRPVKRYESSKDPVFDEMYGDDKQQKQFAKKLASQSDGIIMAREPLPGAREAGFGDIPAQARPDNKVVIDQRGKARKQNELNSAIKRKEQLEGMSGDDIIKEREARVNKLKKDLNATKTFDKEDLTNGPKKKLAKADKDLKDAEKSGDEVKINAAKRNRKIAENELKDASKKGNLIESGDRVRAVKLVQQDLDNAIAARDRARANPNKALKDAREAADHQITKKQASLDKSAVKYAFPPGEGSASRMEAHRDPQNIKNLTEGNGRVYFVMEGQIKADAVLSQIKKEDPKAAVVSVPSVTAWNEKEVSWATNKYFKGRDVVLIPDADGVTNDAVVKQARTLSGRMVKDGAGRVTVASPPLVKNKRGKLEVEDVWYPTGVKDGRKGVDDHIGIGRGTLGDLTFNDTPRVKFDLSKETGSRRLRPNSVKNATTTLEAVSDLSGERGAGRISKKSISKATGLPESSVHDSLKTLEKKGYIKRTDIFDPGPLSRGRRETTKDFSEIKRVTKKAGVSIPDLNTKYVFDDDIHETAPIYEILDNRFVTKPGKSKTLASQFKGLQTSDRVVRTPEGAARYGVSIGAKIPGSEFNVSGLIALVNISDEVLEMVEEHLDATGVIQLHLVGKHDQSAHGSGAGSGSLQDRVNSATKKKVLGGGKSGATVTFKDGPKGKVIHKTGINTTTVDAEFLSSKVGEALGSPVPKIERLDNSSLAIDFAPGTIGGKFAQEKGNKVKERERKNLDDVTGLKGSKELALLDIAIGNTDRHGGNIIVQKDRVIGIDHGLGFQKRSRLTLGGPARLFENKWKSEFTKKEVSVARSKLSKLKPEFDNLSRSDWFNQMDSRLSSLEDGAS